VKQPSAMGRMSVGQFIEVSSGFESRVATAEVAS